MASLVHKITVGTLIELDTTLEARYSGYGITPVMFVPRGSLVRVVAADVTPVRGNRTYMVAEFIAEGHGIQSVKVYYAQVRSIQGQSTDRPRVMTTQTAQD